MSALFFPESSAEADFELHVGLNESGQSLTFELNARQDMLALNRKRYGAMKVGGQPDDEIKRFSTSILADRSADRIASRAQGLTQGLLPDNLIADLREFVGQTNRTLWIQSTEPWIPWEALDIGQDRPLFLAESALARWQPPVAKRRQLQARRLGWIASGNLGSLAKERRALEALCQHGIEVVEIAARRDSILAAFTNSDIDIWHFAGHGEERGAEELCFRLDDGHELIPTDFRSVQTQIARRQPIFFFNCCHSAQRDFVLGQQSGWVPTLLKAGAGAVIGASWRVVDGLAAEFAEGFYQAFIGDRLPIGAATQVARQQIRRDDDPTWLAYAVFAHPMARLVEATPAQIASQPRLKLPPEPRDLLTREVPLQQRRHLFLPAVLIFVLLACGFLTFRSAPEEIEIDLITLGFRATVGGPGETFALTDQRLTATHLRFARFSQILFENTLSEPRELRLIALDEAATLSLIGKDHGPIATFDPLTAATGRVFGVDIDHDADPVELVIEAPLTPAGLRLALHQKLTLAGTSLDGPWALAPAFETLVASSPENLLIALELDADLPLTLLSNALPVSAVDLSGPLAGDGKMTSLIIRGTIRRSGQRSEQALHGGELLDLRQVLDLELAHLVVGKSGLELRLRGHIKSSQSIVSSPHRGQIGT